MTTRDPRSEAPGSADAAAEGESSPADPPPPTDAGRSLDDPASTPRTGVREILLILLLAAFAGVRVGLHCMAFPLFGHVDEIQHIDVLLKYASGQLPSVAGDAYLPHSMWLKNYYGSPEYLPPNALPAPPVVWPEPQRKQFLAAYLEKRRLPPKFNHNYEAMQPPTYYLAAGVWLWVGRQIGFDGGVAELYWARGFGGLVAAVMVMLCYGLLRLGVPDASRLLRYGAPALLAVLPQDCFYFISNDAIGAPIAATALLLMLQLRRLDSLGQPSGMGLGLLAGAAASATLLVKITHVLIFFPVGLMLLARARDLRRAGRPPLDAGNRGVLIGALVPIAAWVAYALAVSGEMFGTHHKTVICGFRPQTWAGFVDHPLWTLDGQWTFITHLSGKFWRGETHWQGEEMSSPAVEQVLFATTIVFLAASLIGSWRRRPGALPAILAWPCWTTVVIGGVMMFALSLYWNFDLSVNPSKEFPYVVAGRMLTSLLVPFAILYVDGLQRATGWLGRAAPTLVLVSVLLGLLISELVLMWPVVQSPYNFWHLRA